MSELHFEVTDRAHPDSPELHRIRALVDLPEHGVVAGQLGGYVEGYHNIHEDCRAWVGGDAQVRDHAKLDGYALVTDRARATDNACVTDNAIVDRDSRVFGTTLLFQRARVTDNACVFGEARIFGDARVINQARVSGAARIGGHAQAQAWCQVSGSAILQGDAVVTEYTRVDGNAVLSHDAFVTEPDDVLVVGPIGSENREATLFRTRTGHKLSVGCWHGETLDELQEEVERRAQNWTGHEEFLILRWLDEYRALEALCRIRIDHWNEKYGVS